MLKFLIHLLALATLPSTSLAPFFLNNKEESFGGLHGALLVIFFAPPQEVILF
jgi:hypothetical protein